VTVLLSAAVNHVFAGRSLACDIRTAPLVCGVVDDE
jgi:hypothetical protein